MTRPWNSLEDLRFAARAVRRRPLFACTIAFLIALGIGLSSATYAIVDAMLLRKLPVPQPDQLVRIAGVSEGTGGTLPRSVFERLAGDLNTAASIFAWTGTIVDVQVQDRTEMASILFVTGDYSPQWARARNWADYSILRKRRQSRLSATAFGGTSSARTPT